jgi:hypothetical protein
MTEPTTVYVAMICDRHTDPEPFVFTTADAAIEYAKTAMAEYAHPDAEIEELEIDGWLYHATYSIEGDSVWVVEKELNQP